jgi:hypothetical protein
MAGREAADTISHVGRLQKTQHAGGPKMEAKSIVVAALMLVAVAAPAHAQENCALWGLRSGCSHSDVMREIHRRAAAVPDPLSEPGKQYAPVGAQQQPRSQAELRSICQNNCLKSQSQFLATCSKNSTTVEGYKDAELLRNCNQTAQRLYSSCAELCP